jgi:hypothetical protein
MRFSPPSEPARVAVFAGAEHPLARHAMFYECVDRAVAALGAEAVFVHAELADPAGLPPHLRARLGTGLYVPFALEVEANDLAHFERTAPVRLHRLAEALARHADGTVGEVLAYGEFRQAVHVARWVQGLGASAVLSLGLDAGAFRAFVVSELLDLPRVAAFAEVLPGDMFRALLPLHVAQARSLLVLHDSVRTTLASRCGDEAAQRAAVWDVAAGATAPLVGALGPLLAAPRSPAAPALGPRAAFVTAPAPFVASARSQPFVVVSSERTGSNLLLSLLADRPQFACANELFNPRAIEAGEIDCRPGSALDREALIALRRRDPAGLLAQLGRDADAAGAVRHGFKLHYQHALLDERIVEALVGDPAVRVVHLLRRDRLARWLSLCRARTSDRWYDGQAAGDATEVLPVPETLADFALQELLEARFRAVFAGHDVLELDYAELADDLPAAGRRLGAFLGVELGEVVPRTRKTGPHDPARGIANLLELRLAFAGTRWAHLIP